MQEIHQYSLRTWRGGLHKKFLGQRASCSMSTLFPTKHTPLELLVHCRIILRCLGFWAHALELLTCTSQLESHETTSSTYFRATEAIQETMDATAVLAFAAQLSSEVCAR